MCVVFVIVQQMLALLQSTRVLTRLLLFLIVLPLQLQEEAKMLPLWSGQIWYVTLISLAVFDFVGSFLSCVGNKVHCRS